MRRALIECDECGGDLTKGVTYHIVTISGPADVTETREICADCYPKFRDKLLKAIERKTDAAGK